MDSLRCPKKCRDCAEYRHFSTEQAKIWRISEEFDAMERGRQAGIEEVVEWLVLNPEVKEYLNKRGLKAKLKGWGIK